MTEFQKKIKDRASMLNISHRGIVKLIVDKNFLTDPALEKVILAFEALENKESCK